MFSVNATLDNNGLLTITGTAKNDVIVFKKDITPLTYDAIVNGQLASFEQSDVHSLKILGVGGDDSITNELNLASTLIGGSGNDSIQGGPADDSLEGDGGDDSLAGGEGNNSIDGGGGDNWADYSSPFETAGTYTVFNSNQDTTNVVTKPHGVDTWAPTNIFRMRATPGDDQIGFSPNTDGIIDGGAGDDSINAGRQTSGIGKNVSVTVMGGDGNDTFWCQEDISPGPIFGGNGDDFLLSETGQGFADAGPGNDTVRFDGAGGSSYSPFRAGEGVERIEAPPLSNVAVIGNDLDNEMIGGDDEGGVTLEGAGGNDRITVGRGFPGKTNFLEGQAGNDTLIAAADDTNGNVDFSGGDGNDTVDYSNRTDALNLSLDDQPNDGKSGGTDNIHTDVENLIGGGAADRITGDSAANRIRGNGGNDTIHGGAGNDTLDGGKGHDHLFGDDGNDTLLAMDGNSDTLDGGAGKNSARNDLIDSVSNVDPVL